MARDHLTAPLVSIVIPAYNAAKYISATLSSVLAQTCTAMEIIVVNDGSTDNTVAIVNEYSKNHRIELIDQKNKGAAAARNTGYLQSKGSYIKFLDADDLISTEMIAQQVAIATEYPGCIISAKWGRFYLDDITTFKFNEEECWQNMLPIDWLCSSWKNTQSMTAPGIFLIPKEIIDRAGLWNEELSLLDDTEYFSRTLLAAEKVIFSPCSVLYYRSGLPNNLSGIKTYDGFISAFTAYDNTISAILNKRNDLSTKLICANIWQLFIYDAYPQFPDLVEKAKCNLLQLPAPTLPFPSGGFTGLLKNLVGWKNAKIIKKALTTYIKQ